MFVKILRSDWFKIFKDFKGSHYPQTPCQIFSELIFNTRILILIWQQYDCNHTFSVFSVIIYDTRTNWNNQRLISRLMLLAPDCVWSYSTYQVMQTISSNQPKKNSNSDNCISASLQWFCLQYQRAVMVAHYQAPRPNSACFSQSQCCPFISLKRYLFAIAFKL